MADPLDAAIMAIDDIARQIDAELPQEKILEIGHAAQTLILLRTKQGIDADGNSFAPYTDDYQKLRQKRSLQASPVDLAVTGQMLGAMTVSPSGKNEVTLRFSRSQVDKATRINDGTKNMKAREFFAIRREQELQALADIAGAAKVEQLEKLP